MIYFNLNKLIEYIHCYNYALTESDNSQWKASDTADSISDSRQYE